jgi:hypothetical protein
MIRRWFILAVLCVVSAALLWNFVRDVLLYNPLAEIRSTEKPVSEKPVSKGDFSLAWGREIVEKNLFSPERGYTGSSAPRPNGRPAETSRPIEEERRERPRFTLNGIILNQFGEYVAYLERANGPALSVREGDVYEGATVLRIHERAVEMLWNGEIIILQLSKGKKHKG